MRRILLFFIGSCSKTSVFEQLYYVEDNNSVRVIDAYIDRLDVGAPGFSRPLPHDTGRPMYDPKDLLKLYVYGYMNRIRSSRRLETETKRNLEVIWLLGNLSPDHKTIANFRHENGTVLKGVFRDFVEVWVLHTRKRRR